MSMIKRWPGWLAIAAAAAALLLIGLQRGAEPATADERVQSIAERLACPVCDGESAAGSRSAGAVEIRDLVEVFVSEGKLTDDQIVETVDAAYKEDLRLTPEGSGIGLLAYALPAVAAVAAIGGLALAMFRWRNTSPVAAPSADDIALVADARRLAGEQVDR